jgi:eukaryotic-like serine/threonine-protein kinase
MAKLEMLREAIHELTQVAQTSHHDSQVSGVLDTHQPHEPKLHSDSRYRLLRKVGQGGFGVVFLAEDMLLKRQVAIKVPRPDLLLTKAAVQRLLREAQNVAKLDHPNIVPILATEETSTLPSIIFPYCEGPNLEQWLRSRNEKVSITVAVLIAMRICDGVYHAHTRGIIHRDLKPSNVLLFPPSDGNILHGIDVGDTKWIPKVTDFGVSKELASHEGETSLGMVVGTRAYMAPEQIAGKIALIGTHSDAYTIGLILWELLCHGCESSANYKSQISVDATQLPLSARRFRPEVPQSLDAIVSKSTMHGPEQRYTSVHDLSEDLSRFLEGRPVSAKRFSSVERLRLWIRRQPAIAALVGLTSAVIALSLLLTVVYVLQINQMVEKQVAISNQLYSANNDLQLERDRVKEAANYLKNQLYVKDMSSALQALEAKDLGRCEKLLQKYVGHSTEEDIRETAWGYLWNKLNRTHESLPVSEAAVYFIAFSNDEKTAGLVGKDGKIRLYDYGTKQLLKEWDAGQGELNSIAFRESDSVIATAGDDGCVCLWNSQTGTLVRKIKSFEKPMHQACFYGADWIVVCGRDPVMRIWNWKTGEHVADLSGHEQTIESMEVDEKNRKIYSASRDSTHRVWDMDTLKLERTGVRASEKVNGVLPLAEPACLFFCDQKGNVWREEAIAPHTVSLVVKLNEGAKTIALSPDRKYLAAGSHIGTISVVELDHSGYPTRLDWVLPNDWMSHHGRIHKLSFSKDGYLHSVGEDGRWKRWNLSERSDHASASTAELSPINDARTVTHSPLRLKPFFSQDFDEVLGWKVGTGDIHRLSKENSAAHSYVVHSDRIFSCCKEGSIHAWQVEGMDLNKLWSVETASVSDVGVLDFDANQNLLAVRMDSSASSVRLVNAATGSEVQKFQFEDRFVNQSIRLFEFDSKHGRFAIAVDSKVFLGELSTGTLTGELTHPNGIQGAQFTSDGKTIFTGCDDNKIRKWSLDTGELLSTMEVPQHRVEGIQLSLDDRNLLSYDFGNKLVVWDLNVNEPLIAIPCSREVGKSICIWEDGWLLRAGKDGIIADRVGVSDESLRTNAGPSDGIRSRTKRSD